MSSHMLTMYCPLTTDKTPESLASVDETRLPILMRLTGCHDSPGQQTGQGVAIQRKCGDRQVLCALSRWTGSRAQGDLLHIQGQGEGECNKWTLQ